MSIIDTSDTQPPKYKGFRAGIVPYWIDPDDGTILYMFMKPSDGKYGGTDWQIAKGRFDEGEYNAEEVAIREGSEELGLKRENIKSVHYLDIIRKMYVYFCEVEDMEDFNPFHEETGDVCWLSYDEFLLFGRDIHQDIMEMINDRVLELNSTPSTVEIEY